MALAVQLQLNPRAKPFVPTVKANKLLQHRRGKREEGEAPVSKHQTQLGRVRWASRRGEGKPNPPRETKTSGAIGGRNWRKEVFVQKIIKRKKVCARKKRRRGRTRRRAARRQASNDRDRARRRELVIATHNVRTMAVDGKHGVGRATEVLDVYQEMGCDIIGLQETMRSGQSALLQAGYVVYCSGESGGDGEGKKGQGGVGLAVRKSISRAVARPPEFISDRLLKVTLELCGRARAVTFVVGYAPKDTQSNRKKNAFWTALERVVKEVPEHEQLFVLMDANARTGRGGGGKLGSEECKVLGAYGRDNLNENGERLLSFSANHELALLNTFFSTAKNAISHTFNGRGKECIDYILTRQRDRKFVRDVTVHPQPSFLPISDHNIVTAHVKLLGRFARNRPVREAKGPPPIDRRRLMTDPHLRQQVATAIGDHLRAFPPNGSSADDVESAFTTAILQTAERVAPPRATRLPGRVGGETPRQKQRSAWRWPRDEQPGSGRGLIPRTSS